MRWIRALLNPIRRLIDAGLSCQLCHQPSQQALCTVCNADLPRFEGEDKTNLLLRATIRQHLITPQYHSLKAIGPYQWPLAQMIQGLKFNQQLAQARTLAELFIHTHPTLGEVEALLPVPLHPQRLAQRNYNQSLEICRYLAEHYQLPIIQPCVRNKATEPQALLSAAKRKGNLSNAFRCETPLHYHKIAIVDDVVTTGTTVNSLSEAMHQAQPELHLEVCCMAISLVR